MSGERRVWWPETAGHDSDAYRWLLDETTHRRVQDGDLRSRLGVVG